MILQIELAGSIETAVACNAAIVEDRLNAGEVLITSSGGLRMGLLNAPCWYKNDRRKQARCVQPKHCGTLIPYVHHTKSSQLVDR